MTELVDQLSKNGFYVVKNAVTEKKIEQLLSELDNLSRSIGLNACAAPIGVQKTIATDPIINNIHFHSDAFLDLAVNGEQVELIRLVLNDPFYTLIPDEDVNFILAQCNLRKSDSILDYHVDVRLQIPSTQGHSIQVIVALEDRHKNNGGLKVIPGSHLLGRIETDYLDVASEQFVDLKAGDMVIFWSHLYHGTTGVSPAHTPAWGLLLTYRAWWCKPQFNFVEMFKDRLPALCSKTRTLLGFHSQPASSWDGSPSARQGYSDLLTKRIAK